MKNCKANRIDASGPPKSISRILTRSLETEKSQPEIQNETLLYFQLFYELIADVRFLILAYPTSISVNPTGLGNVPLHDGDMTILMSFLTLTSLSCQFPPNISTSTCKRGAELNVS